MALEGTLRDFALADILQLISLQRKTGLLSLKNPDDTVTLGFVDGKLVSAESSAKRIDTRLGTVLVKTRRLRPEALQKALEIQGQTLQRLGFILLKNGFCSPEDLREGLDLQIRKIVYGLFRWTTGDYIFDQQDRIDYDEEFVTPIGIDSVLLEGARMMDEWPIIERVVRSMDLRYQRVAVAQSVVQAEDEDEVEDVGEATVVRRATERRGGDSIKISRAEWAVYELVDGRRTVAEILERTFLSEFDGCKAFYDLVSRGLVEETDPLAHVSVEHTGTMSIESLSRSRRLAPRQAFLLTLGGVAIAVMSLRIQPYNPANIVTFPARRVALFEAYAKSQSLLRMRRLVEAVDTFYLTEGKYPEAIDALVAGNLLEPDDVLDPWGRRYRYLLQPAEKPEKYYLVGFTPDGKTDVDLVISHKVMQGGPTAGSSLHSKGKEIIVIN